mgnify:CR=1 FL=1
MKRQKAIEIYLKYRPQSENTIQKLMLWDEKADSTTNAIKLGVTVGQASQMKHQFQLKCKVVRGWVMGPKPRSFRVLAYINLKDAGWGIQEIAHLFKVSHQCVSEAINIYRKREEK